MNWIFVCSSFESFKSSTVTDIKLYLDQYLDKQRTIHATWCYCIRLTVICTNSLKRQTMCLKRNTVYESKNNVRRTTSGFILVCCFQGSSVLHSTSCSNLY